MTGYLLPAVAVAAVWLLLLPPRSWHKFEVTKHCGNGSCGRIVIEQPMVVVTVVTALLL